MKNNKTKIKTMFKHFMSKKQHYSPGKMDSPNAQDSTDAVPPNKKDPQLEHGHYTQIGGM